MYNIIILIIAALVIAAIWMRYELFGESIYLDNSSDVRGDSKTRPAVYTSGATQRNVGQLFSSTDQGTNRTY